MTEHIVFYGKGGVGTSTLTANITAALVEAGFRVLQIGCGSKTDSCWLLNQGLPIPTVWESCAANGTISFDAVITRGFKGAYCVELGHPDADQENAGVVALEQLLKHHLIQTLVPHFVLYDLSGDQANLFRFLTEKVPLERVYAVTTADYMALGAVNSVLLQLERLGETHVPVPFGGLLPNSISCSFGQSFVSDFARITGTRTLPRIPRSQVVLHAELYGKTVIEAAPLSNQSYFYRRLANEIADGDRGNNRIGLPRPLQHQQLREWAQQWGERLYALEHGLVSDGAAI